MQVSGSALVAHDGAGMPAQVVPGFKETSWRPQGVDSSWIEEARGMSDADDGMSEAQSSGVQSSRTRGPSRAQSAMGGAGKVPVGLMAQQRRPTARAQADKAAKAPAAQKVVPLTAANLVKHTSECSDSPRSKLSRGSHSIARFLVKEDAENVALEDRAPSQPSGSLPQEVAVKRAMPPGINPLKLGALR